MTNHNFIRIGLVKAITEQRSEDVRDSLGSLGETAPGRKFSGKALLVCSKLCGCWESECCCSNILGVFFYPPPQILEKRGKQRFGLEIIQFWCAGRAFLRPVEDSSDIETRRCRLCLVITSALRGHILALILLLSLVLLNGGYNVDNWPFLTCSVNSRLQVENCRGYKRAKLLTFFILGHAGQLCSKAEGSHVVNSSIIEYYILVALAII